jgi:hypothetical protein
VVVRADVAAEHNLLPALRAAGLDATMDQTGGMCSAANVTLADGAYVLIVDSEAVEAYGERFHVIHYADDSDDCEGEQVGPDEGVPASEVVAAVTTLATLQRV